MFQVYIAGHVPPGYFEFVSNYHKRWYYDYYNERFVQIIRDHKDVIFGMFFGHHHSDTFRIIKDADGNIARIELVVFDLLSLHVLNRFFLLPCNRYNPFFLLLVLHHGQQRCQE